MKLLERIGTSADEKQLCWVVKPIHMAVNPASDMGATIEDRLRKANATFAALNRIWVAKKLSKTTKALMDHSFVRIPVCLSCAHASLSQERSCQAL